MKKLIASLVLLASQSVFATQYALVTGGVDLRTVQPNQAVDFRTLSAEQQLIVRSINRQQIELASRFDRLTNFMEKNMQYWVQDSLARPIVQLIVGVGSVIIRIPEGGVNSRNIFIPNQELQGLARAKNLGAVALAIVGIEGMLETAFRVDNENSRDHYRWIAATPEANNAELAKINRQMFLNAVRLNEILNPQGSGS